MSTNCSSNGFICLDISHTSRRQMW